MPAIGFVGQVDSSNELVMSNDTLSEVNVRDINKNNWFGDTVE